MAANRFTWDQAAGTEPSIEQLKSLLMDISTVMQEQKDDNGDTFGEANADLAVEVAEFLGFVDACHFASGEVIFRSEK